MNPPLDPLEEIWSDLRSLPAYPSRLEYGLETRVAARWRAERSISTLEAGWKLLPWGAGLALLSLCVFSIANFAYLSAASHAIIFGDQAWLLAYY